MPLYAWPPLAVGDAVLYFTAAESDFPEMEEWPTPRPTGVRVVEAVFVMETVFEGGIGGQRFVQVSGFPEKLWWDQRLWRPVSTSIREKFGLGG